MTDGGLGIAFFSPFNLQRYFLPWRPIHVSPIGVSRFFSARGLRILWSEILWVWLPILGRLRFGKSDTISSTKNHSKLWILRVSELSFTLESKASGNPFWSE